MLSQQCHSGPVFFNTVGGLQTVLQFSPSHYGHGQTDGVDALQSLEKAGGVAPKQGHTGACVQEVQGTQRGSRS
jgi:hypothetical protein